MNGKRLIWYAAFWSVIQVLQATGQDAILPQGDPRLRDNAQESEQRDAAHDSRLKQQGQGPNYRIEGTLQRGANEETSSDQKHQAQDTGLADPTVNPGQASGMRVVRGAVKQASVKTIVIEDSQGKETTMSVDAATAGDRDVRPGDVITGTITGQGRAVAIHKEAGADR